MGRNRSNYTESDVRRAITGARKAGLEVKRVEIDPSGKIILLNEASTEPPEENSGEPNPWDEE